MKRKRFIKLAMAHGFQRNTAEQMAKNVQTAKSYKNLYKQYRMTFAIKTISIAFCKSWKRAVIAVKAISLAFKAIPHPLQINTDGLKLELNRRTADNENN